MIGTLVMLVIVAVVVFVIFGMIAPDLAFGWVAYGIRWIVDGVGMIVGAMAGG